MKQRQRQKPARESVSGTRVEFVDVAQPGMRILKGLDLGAESFAGCYVKVAPVVKSSERASLDTKLVRQQLLAAGATAVVVVPVVVPDSTADMKQPKPMRRVSSEVHLKEWFDGVKAVAPKVLAEAFAEALTTIGEAGL